MTNVEGRKPEGAPERSPKAGEGECPAVSTGTQKLKASLALEIKP
jgi:hypothetical protein